MYLKSRAVEFAGADEIILKFIKYVRQRMITMVLMLCIGHGNTSTHPRGGEKE